MNNEQERIGKGSVVFRFGALSRYFPGIAEEYPEERQSA
jgi:hypothetical protein